MLSFKVTTCSPQLQMTVAMLICLTIKKKVSLHEVSCSHSIVMISSTMQLGFSVFQHRRVHLEQQLFCRKNSTIACKGDYSRKSILRGTVCVVRCFILRFKLKEGLTQSGKVQASWRYWNKIFTFILCSVIKTSQFAIFPLTTNTFNAPNAWTTKDGLIGTLGWLQRCRTR